MRREGVLQVVFSDVEGKIPDKQFRTHLIYFLCCPSLFLTLRAVPGYRVSIISEPSSPDNFHAVGIDKFLETRAILTRFQGIASGIFILIFD